MPATTEPKFNCGTCGKEYRWKPELAGKKAKCKCGNVIAVPVSSPAAARPAARKPDADVDLDGLYALAQEEKKATARPVADESAGGYRCPSCSATLPPGTSVCPNCRTDMRTGVRQVALAGAGGGGGVLAAAGAYASTTPTARHGVLPYGGGAAEGRQRADADIIWEGGKARSLYLPLGLIILGVLFYFGQLAVSNNKLGAAMMVVMVGLRIIMDSLLIFVSMLIAVRGFDMGFGAFGPGVLKILAIAMAPGALGQLVGGWVGGGMTGLMVGGFLTIILYYALIKILFNLDLGETFLLVFLIYGVQQVLGTFLLVALMGMASSGAMETDSALAVGGGAFAISNATVDGEDDVPPKRALGAAEIAEDLDSGALSTRRFVKGGSEAMGYLESNEVHSFINMDKAKSAEIVKAFMERGAKEVTVVDWADVEGEGGRREQKAQGLMIELPEDAAQRKKVFEFRADLLKSIGEKEVMVQVEVGGREDEPKKEEPLKDWGQKYMMLNLGYGKAKGWVDPRFKRMLEEAGDEDDEGEDMEGDAPATPPADAAPPAPAAPGNAEEAAPGGTEGEAPATPAEAAPF